VRSVPTFTITAVACLGLVASALIPVSGTHAATAGSRLAAASCTSGKPKPPSMAGAPKKYKGQQIIYYGDAVGCGHDIDLALANQFTKDTGIKVKVVEKPPTRTRHTRPTPACSRAGRPRSTS